MQRHYELSRDEKSRTMAWHATNDQCMAHFHSSIELVYVESGAISALQDAAVTLAPAGHLIVNSSYVLHSYSTPEASRTIICTIPLGAAPKLRATLSQRHFAKSVVDVRGMKECRRMLRMMADAANSTNADFVNSMGEALLALLIERIGLEDNTASSESDLMKRILIYLQDHASEPITVAQAAAHFGYSTGRFSHIFNARIGCPFTRYVNSLRCAKAQQLLSQGGMPLIDVATACGFSSLRTFHRVYKAFCGATPRSSPRQLENAAGSSQSV